ncbi:MAG: T9SS type A sorting domain-containing protein [Crocinitomicaceae bacterium]
MNKGSRTQFIFMLSVFFTAISSVKAQNPCWSLGTGSDGAYHATSNTTLLGGNYNYSSFTIDSGVTVTVTGNLALQIHCSSVVAINGILTASGSNGLDGVTYTSAGIGGTGVAGGANGGNGTFSATVGPLTATDGLNTGGIGTAGAGWSGGGGAGYAFVGDSTHGVGGFGGPTYGLPNLSGLWAGSGGGGGSGGYNCGAGGGGAGGGVIVINAMAIAIGISGIIKCDGGNGGSDGAGNCGGGGGGSGGSIWLGAPSIVNNGNISVSGGLGGSSQIGGTPYFGIGGNGSQGRMRIDGGLSGSGVTSTTPVTSYPLPVSSSTHTICSGDTVLLGTTAYTTTGLYNAILTSPVGCDSIVQLDLTVLPANETILNLEICEGVVVTIGTSVYSQTGTYQDILTATNGCDSIITTNLVVNSPDLTISFNTGVYTANQAGGTYQWIDCTPGQGIVVGATAQTFTPVGISGNYAVEVTFNGCTGTSDCLSYDFTGLESIDQFFMQLYPNPTKGEFNIDFGAEVQIESIVMKDLSGRTILVERDFTAQTVLLDLSNESDGVYFLQVTVNGKLRVVKVVKQ